MSNKPKPKASAPTPRLQPIRATKPFQLRQGSPARKSPSSSPTSMLPRPGSDPRRNKWSSDHRNSPDRAERKSPSSPGIKVTNRRSPSPRVCRSSSHDPVGSYLTGQWPRDITSSTFFPLSNSGTSNKSTQTPVDWNSETLSSQSKNSKGLSRPVAYQDHVEFKQMRQQMRRLAKSSRLEKKSPVHANHSALPQSQTTQQRSISNPMPIYGRLPRRQNSWEGLNKEIENYTIIDSNDTNKFTGHGITPPDGHRAPLPRSATRSMETQTPQGFARDNTPASAESHTPSPSHDQNLHIGKSTIVGEAGQSPYPKYASSPRPNNSYMFKREPPEGAESVKPFKEQDMQNPIGPSCPDKQKINFQISQNGSFKKWKRLSLIHI